MSIWAGRFGGLRCSRESVTCGKGSMSKVGPTVKFAWSLVAGQDLLGPMDLVLSLLETLETCLSDQRPAEGTARVKVHEFGTSKNHECRSFRGQPSLRCPQSVVLLTYTEVYVSANYETELWYNLYSTPRFSSRPPIGGTPLSVLNYALNPTHKVSVLRIFHFEDARFSSVPSCYME